MTVSQIMIVIRVFELIEVSDSICAGINNCWFFTKMLSYFLGDIYFVHLPLYNIFQIG